MKLPDTYSPDQFEERIYSFWEKEGLFHAERSDQKNPFSIVIPPPNITGVLHMGHGLNNTLQDVLIRWQRMQGREACWIPGTDHAGIATQNVVEKKIRKDSGKTRDDVGRKDFIKEVWKWKEEHGHTIIHQLKKLGSSCDWDRVRFTMDEGLSNAVREVFVRLYEKNLIYRGKYIINWCPRCRTALSDEEAEHQEQEGGLYHILYPVKGEDRSVTVATTRPETLLGDTAVAVNPKDDRYNDLIGKTLVLPMTGREIPVISDPFVDPEFGTGCVKVTPAHDPNDFEMGLRHKLQSINVMNPDGTMNENCPEEYRGMDRFECRKALIADLQKRNLFQKREPHSHSVGHCYRCDTVVEPRLSEQWFVKMKPLAKPALQAVETGKINFYPERWKKVYLNWMNNIRDWCISRQIWWGHRIPVWYCSCGEVIVSRTDPKNCPKCQNKEIKQDEDVLDTWFSSWLWPFSTLNWPQDNPDLDFFYPTNVLITDPGIIFFWVARMIMAGIEFTGKIPFSDVYIHGVILDDKGRKMSKSLGNGIDPLDVIKEYGADALRYTILSITAQGQNVLLSMDKFQIGKFFANKIWNAAKYVLMNAENIQPESAELPLICDLNTADQWILHSLEELKRSVRENLEKYRFNDACLALHDFFWHRFCDWYLEISKVDLYSDDPEKQKKAMAVLLYLLRQALILLHPVMPYLTEEIWHHIPGSDGSIMKQAWPKENPEYHFPEQAESFEFIKTIVYHVRNIRGEMEIPKKKAISILIRCSNKHKLDLLSLYGDYMRFLANVESIECGPDTEKPEASSSAAADDETEIFVPMKGNIDLEKEKQRLNKEAEKIEKDLEKYHHRLNNKNFTDRAPEEVVSRVKQESQDLKDKLSLIRKNLNSLS